MDTWENLTIVSAVIFGNALSFAFFMAAMKASKLQKTGVPDDRLPLWVYGGLIAAPLVFAAGSAFLT